jgi:DNA-directed RNA polymerase sigma subunit (sigma70/sigma32)
MAKRDPQRTERLRKAVRYLLDRGELQAGSQSRLAEHFQVSRQRVHQIVVEERRHLPRESHSSIAGAPLAG